MLTHQEEVLISLTKLKGIGNVTLRQLLHQIESGASIDEISQTSQKINKALESTPNYYDLMEADITSCINQDVSILSIFDPRFPKGLKADSKGPVFIYVKGNIDVLTQPSLAIIGTRKPDGLATEYAERVTSHFAQKGVPILSGLALGCDTIAHQTTVNLGGKAIAVLGHGLHMISPNQSFSLATSIVDTGGVLVSEYPMGTAPNKYTFVQRDKTQACIAEAILLIQSSLDGGSLHACRSSVKMGKKVFALPPTDASIEDANSIIHHGYDGLKDLLKCDDLGASRVIPITSKDDYHLIDTLF
jgi:DNA processing protein